METCNAYRHPRVRFHKRPVVEGQNYPEGFLTNCLIGIGGWSLGVGRIGDGPAANR